MTDILYNIIEAFWAQSWLEMVAVLCALLYLILVVKENIWCWFFAFISTAIFIYLFYHVSLLSESLLNIYYLVMAVYGWWQWRQKSDQPSAQIHHWPLKKHLIVCATTIILTPIIGFLMKKLGASFPYIDAFVAILAVIATMMVAYKVFENWYYWLLVDTISIYLFWQKELYLTAILFVIYITLIFIGIKQWKTLLQQQQNQQ